MMLFVIILILIVLIIAVRNIVVVQQSRAYVVERLGAFQTVWGVGLHFKVPFIDRVARRVSLKEQVVDKITASIRQTAASGSHFSKMLTPEEEEIMREIIREFMNAE